MDENVSQKPIENLVKKESKFTTLKVTKEAAHKLKKVAVDKKVKMYELLDEIAKNL